jgi:hypothetical protein
MDTQAQLEHHAQLAAASSGDVGGGGGVSSHPGEGNDNEMQS